MLHKSNQSNSRRIPLWEPQEKKADKRTPEQRSNDIAQNARPKGAQDTTFVTTGPATGKEDERAIDTED